MSCRLEASWLVIGRIIDKYEILEEVGQGGMAIVYRGRDTSLQRDVAVKILHRHLASLGEARERLEREARAVAKLRHENIIEIFDYSGKESEESYIVTEFISGTTLKEFANDNEFVYPEVGMLIVVEVCAALVHAHSLGVLHRDIKPENIMIRNDGVLKLMDFGIAQIVDAQRLTVTGTLLGSPAYMSPEHVEGRRLDFRTDVFSVGILLYQLCTGELPFKGRTPHEILKRIGDCKMLDARVVNPQIGNRLGKIIRRAMAKSPDDRYPDVAPLLADLKSALAEAGLGDTRREKTKFFENPTVFQENLGARLVAALSERADEELAKNKVSLALELFNRILTIDANNEAVLRKLDRLSQRRRGKHVVIAATAAMLLGGGVYAALPGDSHAPSVDAGALVAPVPMDGALIAAAPPDANLAVVLASRPDASRSIHRPPPVPTKLISVKVVPGSAACRIGSGPFAKVKGGSLRIAVRDKPVVVECRHDLTESKQLTLRPKQASDRERLVLPFLPTTLTPKCALASKGISVDGRVLRSGVPLPFFGTDLGRGGKKMVKVQFFLPDETQTKMITVVAGVPIEVNCDAP